MYCLLKTHELVADSLVKPPPVCNASFNLDADALFFHVTLLRIIYYFTVCFIGREDVS